MIYFDNAATTRKKPQEVLDAFTYYLTEVGTSPGRGCYSLGIQASRMLYQSRKAVCGFFGCPSAANVVFTKNSTEAINLLVCGLLKPGDHVLISSFEHNAVLRPLHSLKEKGLIDYSVLPEAVFERPEELLDVHIRPNTRLACVTLASNLTGQIVFNSKFATACKRRGVQVAVDASQGGGKGLADMSRDDIDYLAFTGHKDLLALPGVGGLCSREPLHFRPLIQGGTGIHGEFYVNPDIYPEAYESGTLNMPAIWALKTSIEYIQKNQIRINEKEGQLTDMLLAGMKRLENVQIYKPEAERVPTICFNVKGVPSSDVVSILDKHQICVRGGIHCAVLAHTTLGTVRSGAVRVSMNYENSEEEIETFLQILGGIR